MAQLFIGGFKNASLQPLLTVWHLLKIVDIFQVADEGNAQFQTNMH